MEERGRRLEAQAPVPALLLSVPCLHGQANWLSSVVFPCALGDNCINVCSPSLLKFVASWSYDFTDCRFSVLAASHSTSQLSQKLKTTYKASTSKVCKALARGPAMWYVRWAHVYSELCSFQLEMCDRI